MAKQLIRIAGGGLAWIEETAKQMMERLRNRTRRGNKYAGLKPSEQRNSAGQRRVRRRATKPTEEAPVETCVDEGFEYRVLDE